MSQLADFTAFCERRTGRRLSEPGALQAFSVADHRAFWALFLEWADPPRGGRPDPICTDDRCEAAEFFPNLELNYAECLLHPRSPADDERIAIVARHELGPTERVTRGELRRRVRQVAGHLRSLGIGEGDRVAAIAHNNAEAAIAALAAAALGATFSSAAPEMGAHAILARFEQVSPRLLIANLEGGSSGSPLAERVGEVAAALPEVEAVLALDEGASSSLDRPLLRFADLLEAPAEEPLEEGWRRFPFNHPLFVLFTSGTTGPPKCLVHGAGGTLLEHLKEQRLHLDLSPRDTLYFHSSTAWMMWNWQLSALAAGTAIVTFDGRLSGPAALWEIVAEEDVSVFGTSPPYLQLCEDAGLSPLGLGPMPRLRSILSTGSVLRDWQFDWVERELGGVRLQSISGGTDIVGCFVLGHPELPIRRGMIQCRSLGLDVQALRTEATPAGSRAGELVCRNPFPSRPLGILGDGDGSRFHEAYFAAHEGVWTHGDLIEFDDDGQSRILGRSDGVLNVQGVRIGPAEIYEALHEVPEVEEAMAVEQPRGRGSRLVLLAVLREGESLDGRLTSRIRRTIARDTTPLHVPALVVAVDELPVTHSGKRSERAASAAVAGDRAANLRALANPGSVEGISRAVRAAESGRSAASREADAGGDTRARLRAIWEDLLDLAPIEDEDDFFEIGGTSLLAVRLFQLIDERLGARLHLSTLFEASTIATLAALIDDPERKAERVVLMRRGRESPPLFLIHSLWGDVLGMRQVAQALRTDVPVYGIRAVSEDGRTWAGITIEELARSYVRVLRSAQPQPPYRIAGHSFGALLAFELARQLEELGLEVGWLGMIDGELSTASLPPLRRWGHRIAMPYHLARAALRDPRAAVRALPGTVASGLRGLGGRRDAPEAALAEPPPGWMEGASPYYQEMARAFLAAAEAFRPRPYQGEVTYFLPRVRRFHLYADPLPVWRRVAEGGLALEPVPGPHVGMVSGERAAIVAGIIDRRLGGAGDGDASSKGEASARPMD